MAEVRAIFLSDVHLGTRACQAQRLLEFLREYDSHYLFLVGDIVDFLAMGQSGPYWSAAMNTVVQKVLKRARHGAKVVFVPGNHDEALREYVGICFGDIEVHRDYIHTAADGKRYVLLHGDEFDAVAKHHRLIAALGDYAYAAILRLNVLSSWMRRRLGIAGYWSFAGYAKRKLKTALRYIRDFEHAVVRGVRERGCDGVVCGHVHAAAIKQVDGVIYVNCGDWVDSCTAVVEHYDGRMELVDWGLRLPTASSPPELAPSKTDAAGGPAIVCQAPTEGEYETLLGVSARSSHSS